MKRGLLLLLACAACSQDAHVLGLDGKERAYCNSTAWVDCVAQACPNGYTVSYNSNASGNASIIVCKDGK